MIIDLELREYWKDQLTRKKDVEPSDVTMAVANIYQDEAGHMVEEEGYGDLLDRIVELAEKHSRETKDYDALVDVILDAMHRADAEAGLQ